METLTIINTATGETTTSRIIPIEEGMELLKKIEQETEEREKKANQITITPCSEEEASEFLSEMFSRCYPQFFRRKARK